MYGLDNSGPLLVLDTECIGTKKLLDQMVAGDIPNVLPQLSPQLLVDSGFLMGKFLFELYSVCLSTTVFKDLHSRHYRILNRFSVMTNIPIRLHLQNLRPLKKGEITSDVLMSLITLCTDRSSIYYALFSLNRQLYGKFSFT